MARTSNYSEKLKNPKWQKRRLEILNLHGFRCEKCGCEDRELHVHHRFYIKGREVWQYDNDVFQVLCEDCHKKEHKNEEKIVEVIPKKYEEIIMNLEMHGDVDLSNVNCFLNLINSKEEFDEIFSLLSRAINSSWLEPALNIIRDKQTIENLDISLEIIKNDFEKRIKYLESNTGFEYKYPSFKYSDTSNL